MNVSFHNGGGIKPGAQIVDVDPSLITHLSGIEVSSETERVVIRFVLPTKSNVANTDPLLEPSDESQELDITITSPIKMPKGPLTREDLINLRRQYCMTPREWAAHLGVHARTIIYFEKGRYLRKHIADQMSEKLEHTLSSSLVLPRDRKYLGPRGFWYKRQDMGMSQWAFANFLGVCPNTVWAFENAHDIRATTAAKIREKLGEEVNPGWIASEGWASHSKTGKRHLAGLTF